MTTNNKEQEEKDREAFRSAEYASQSSNLRKEEFMFFAAIKWNRQDQEARIKELEADLERIEFNHNKYSMKIKELEADLK